MSYSAIKEIFLNNLYISENMPVSDEHKKIVKKIFEFEEKIKKYFPKKDREKIMREYSLLYGELISDVESTGFAEGFKTGLLIGAEVFTVRKNAE